MKKPNYFIIGAPKCGTTALREYLRNHPQIFMSTPKEPRFFAEDFPDRFRPVKTMEEYMKLFSGARENHVAVGEASPIYLYSSVAIKQIYRFDPRARIIAMLRNPVDLVYSLHAQMFYTRDEDEGDFQKAWYLQAERERGLRIPKHCRAPALLQYSQRGKLGEQIERLFSIFPRSQIKIILFDDFKRSTKTVYEEVLSFLGVQTDGRTEFPRINEMKIYKVEWIATITQRPPHWIIDMANNIKRIFGIEKLGVLNTVMSLNTEKVSRKPLSIVFRRELEIYFKDDTRMLSTLIRRDLSGWMK